MSKNRLAGIIPACIMVIIIIVVMITTRPMATPSYTLSISVGPLGAGWVSPWGSEYESGTHLTLTASPISGYAFDHWSGGASGNTSSTAIIMESDKSLTANFKAQDGSLPPSYMPDEIIVGFKPGVNQTIRDELLQSYNLTKYHEIPQINVEVVKVDPDKLDEVIETLSNNPNVRYAERNGICHIAPLS